MDIGKVIRELDVELDEAVVPTREKPAPNQKPAEAPVEHPAVPE